MPIAPEDRRKLVELARAAVASQVRGDRPPAVDEEGLLGEQRGCFVTLTNNDALRGCIGAFQPRGPLGRTIVEMGAAAARDPRFTWNPITPGEVDELTVEVSVLSPLTKTDDPLSLELGKHGIYVKRGFQAGCFLPEVATDQGWDAETFLTQCCAGKADMPPDAWKLSDTDVYLFTSEKFSE